LILRGTAGNRNLHSGFRETDELRAAIEHWLGGAMWTRNVRVWAKTWDLRSVACRGNDKRIRAWFWIRSTDEPSQMVKVGVERNAWVDSVYGALRELSFDT